MQTAGVEVRATPPNTFVVFGRVREPGAGGIPGVRVGGTGQFTDGIIFTVGGGKTTEIGTLGIGDRADGGIDGVKIENGLLLVRRHGTDSGRRCCPEYVETTTYRLTGNKLVPVGKARASLKLDRN
jgi:hypothetical protein